MGPAWHVFYDRLARSPRVAAYVSSMADGSGGDDSCSADDTALPLDSSRMDSWSATRWVARIADQYGLAKSGENPARNAPPRRTRTTSTRHGLAAVSVDGGRETVVDYYSAVRAEAQVVYRSRLLAPGDHMLTLRVLGQRSPAASGTTVSLDRVRAVDAG